jgi:hypothetical protein
MDEVCDADIDQRVQPHPNVVDTDVGDGEIALLHLDNKHYFSLNATGGRIWQGLKEGLTPKEISERLQSEFKVDASKADQSVLSLIADLLDQDLVTRL